MGVQRRLVELYGRMQRYQDALDHLNYMLEKEPNDAKLQSLRATYRWCGSGNLNEAATYSYKLIGYDPKTDTFDEKQATAPNDVAVYANLATILHGKQDKPELADRVMEQMIKLNPESASAYLSRGGYWIAWDQEERGREDIEKAYQLSPQDADVLLVMADQAAKNKQTDKAREYLATGKKLHPEDPRFYQAAADLESKQEKYTEAMAEIDAGLKAVGTQKGAMLLFYKAELQFHNNDLKGVEQTIQEMKSAGFRPEFLEWHQARIMLAEGKWFEASEALNRLRPRAGDIGDLPTQIDYFLGMCYERLGRMDLARNAYELVLAQDPKNETAQAGKQRVMAMIKPDELAIASDPLQKELSDEMSKPKDQQDWAKIDELVKQMATARKMDELQLKILQVNLR